MAQNSPHLSWNILSDEEVTSVQADAFGIHTAYARLLQRVATDCPTPIAIGLYSTWGSGKTSIIRLLQAIIAKDTHSALTLIYLDVWKYSADPLKRWILLETERQLTECKLLNGPYKYQERNLQSHLEFEESLEDKDRVEIDFKNFGRLIGIVLTCIVIGGLAWLYIPTTSRFLQGLRWLMGLVTSGGVLALAGC